MKTKLIIVLIAAFCACSVFAFSTATAGPPKAKNTAEGSLTLSDGSTYKGKIYLTGKKPLTIYLKKSRTRQTFLFSQIRSLEFTTLKAEKKKKFIFKESGKDEKIESGEERPRLDISVTVNLKSGKSVTGTVQPTTIYIENDGERERFQLLKLIHGETGEALDGLVYVKKVQFGGGDEKEIRYMITGAVKPASMLAEVAAWRRGTLTVYKGKVAAGKYEIEVPQAGAYDIMLTLNSEIRFWIGIYDNGAEGPDPEDIVAADVATFIETTDKDFFDTRSAIKIIGDNKWAIAIIDKWRTEPTHYNKTENPDARFRRVDVWQLEHTNVRWRIEKRVNLHRERLETKESKSLTFRMDKTMGGVVVTEKEPVATRDLDVAESSVERPGELPEAPPGKPTEEENKGTGEQGNKGRGKKGE